MSNDHAMSLSQAKKRKAGQDGNRTPADTNSRAPKRRRFEHAAKQRDARTIATQTSFQAFKHGELDIDKFVKSREYEIQSLERGLVNSKKVLMKRAFQLVPKELRRRTASHNVQRVPKRLRARARKEMKEDKTPTVTAKKRKPNSHMRLRLETAKNLRHLGSRKTTVNGQRKAVARGDPTTTKNKIKTRPAKIKRPTLAAAPLAKAKFRKRQRDKTWLPTHLFHAKRARMTATSQPLWRFALPLTPTAKSYRSVHRVVSERGAMAWDTSYYSTIQLDGTKSSLNLLLKALGVEEQLTRRRKHDVRGWLLGNRALTLDLHHRDRSTQHIAPASIIWSHRPCGPPELSTDHQQSVLWIRVHPAAFLELWEELVRVSKTVKPHVTVADMRYEIGSIEIVGPEATDALLSVLKPRRVEDFTANTLSTHAHDDRTFFKQLHGMSSTAVLELGTLLSFEVDDPRLYYPAHSTHASTKRQSSAALLETISQRNNFRRSAILDIMDREKRVKACSKIPSQKALDRRRRAAPPGQLPTKLESDPSVPVLLFTSPDENSKKPLSKWTVMLPWKWVQFTWYCLMYTPLSSGAQPRFGGLDELGVLALEHGKPSFPADYPASSSGWAHELQARSQRHGAWKRRPKSKRVNWDRLTISAKERGEIGLGWACDWEKLLSEISEDPTGTPARANGQDDAPKPAQDSWSSLNMIQLSGFDANHHLQNAEPLSTNLSNALFTVRIEALPRGVAQACARVYRLPSSGELRTRWLQQHPALSFNQRSLQKRLPSLPENAPAHEVRRELARSLLLPTLPGQDDYPTCPGEEDLIGFVTSGNYDLGAGKGVAIGNLSLRMVCDGWKAKATSANGSLDTRHLCIVRNSGQTVGRLAKWETVL